MKTTTLVKWIPYVIIFLLGTGLFFVQKRSNNLQRELKTEIKLKNALIDSVSIYKNKEGELVAEKLSLQTSIKKLQELNDNLTDNQQDLVNRIKNLKKDKETIAAALIKSNIIIDSLMKTQIVVVNDSLNSVSFKDSTKFIKYDIVVGEVKRVSTLKTPTLTFKQFELPNDQFIEFSWKNNKKEGYPVTFSVTNTNPYFKTYNIDSYIIPEVDKPIIKPTWWQKNKVVIKQVGTVGLSVGIGAFLVYMLK
jgi:hypothetical protein